MGIGGLGLGKVGRACRSGWQAKVGACGGGANGARRGAVIPKRARAFVLWVIWGVSEIRGYLLGGPYRTGILLVGEGYHRSSLSSHVRPSWGDPDLSGLTDVVIRCPSGDDLPPKPCNLLHVGQRPCSLEPASI